MTPSSPLDALIAELERATAGSEELDVAITRWLHSYTEDVWYTQSFTRSLDSALTLVPDRHRFILDKRPGAEERQDGYRADVYREAYHYKSDGSDTPRAWAKTPALALCIAALKARTRREDHG